MNQQVSLLFFDRQVKTIFFGCSMIIWVTFVTKEIWVYLNEYSNDDGWVYICKKGMWDSSGDGVNPLMSIPNMEVIYQVWGRLMYVKGFQLTTGIQHSILQIWVSVRKVYANESVCDAWMWFGECVRKLDVWMPYRCLDALPSGLVLCGRCEIVCVDGVFPPDRYCDW